MSSEVEYLCFVSGLASATGDQELQNAFSQFGEVIDSKIIHDRETGRSRGFGYVTFKDEKAMRDAIEEMNGKKLDGSNITVKEEAQSRDAIEEMNGKELDGRTITVNEAQSRESGGGGDRGGGGYLYAVGSADAAPRERRGGGGGYIREGSGC